MLNHKIGIRKIIEKRLNEDTKYIDILRLLYGADPREVWDIYKEYKNEPDVRKEWVNFYPEYPEPHPAYSQWRMTPEATRLIIGKISEKFYKSICFLSCPILGMNFAKINPGIATILDLDKDILNCAKELAKTEKYNINNDVPLEFRNKFECVVCDPPWYYEDIELVIARAAALVIPGGSIYLSLPRLLTKPSILNERMRLQKKMSDWELVIAEIAPIVSYEVPPFELMAYQDISAFSGAIWRSGDWLKLKKSGDIAEYQVDMLSSSMSWLEYSFGKKRMFLKNITKKDEYAAPVLFHLFSDDILNSVSRRNPIIKQIGIWSSRNAVLGIKSGYSVIKLIMDNLTKENNEIIVLIAEKYNIEQSRVNKECSRAIDEIKNILLI